MGRALVPARLIDFVIGQDAKRNLYRNAGQPGDIEAIGLGYCCRVCDLDMHQSATNDMAHIGIIGIALWSRL